MKRVATVLLLSLLVSALARADVVAIVAPKSPLEHLSKKALADLFLGRTARLPDGSQAVPIDQDEGSPARDEFYAAVTGKNPAQVKEHWSKVIFTGRGKPPVAAANGAEARKWVAANPRAIAYIERSQLDSSVRVLQVE